MKKKEESLKFKHARAFCLFLVRYYFNRMCSRRTFILKMFVVIFGAEGEHERDVESKWNEQNRRGKRERKQAIE